MASKVLVPVAPFAKLQVKKSPPESTSGAFLVGNDPIARVAHLEHSVRFLQEQHRLMLSGLHAEIEALRERNRDLQFQLIFNKESSAKASTPPVDENVESEESRLKREVARLEHEATSARSDTRTAEAKVLQLQTLIDAQTEKLRVLELKPCTCAVASAEADATATAEEDTSRAELRARLAEAERLVRRLRGDAERQRREVIHVPLPGSSLLHSGAKIDLLNDAIHTGRGTKDAIFPMRQLCKKYRGAHRNLHKVIVDLENAYDKTVNYFMLQCMKNSLHASLRASGLDSFGYQNNYHFPPVHTPDFWREPLRDDFNVIGSRGRSTRRPLTLPELSGQQMHRSTIYANKFADQVRPRANGYDKTKKNQPTNGEATSNTTKSSEDSTENRLRSIYTNDLQNTTDHCKTNSNAIYPELKIVITKLITHGQVSNGQSTEAGTRPRPRRHHHRKHATDHT